MSYSLWRWWGRWWFFGGFEGSREGSVGSAGSRWEAWWKRLPTILTTIHHHHPDDHHHHHHYPDECIGINRIVWSATKMEPPRAWKENWFKFSHFPTFSHSSAAFSKELFLQQHGRIDLGSILVIAREKELWHNLGTRSQLIWPLDGWRRNSQGFRRSFHLIPRSLHAICGGSGVPAWS